MRLWLLVTFALICLFFFKVCDSGCSSYYRYRYTCYRARKWKTTQRRCRNWLWRRRCRDRITYFNKYTKSTCSSSWKCSSFYGWSNWGSWTNYYSCPASSYRRRSQYKTQYKYKYQTCRTYSSRCCYCGRKGNRKSTSYGQKCRQGGWSSWSFTAIGSCSASCKRCGSSTNPRRRYKKRRSCNNPTPYGYKTYCRGSSTSYTYLSCNTHYCKVNGNWGSWGGWSSWNRCSASCRTCGSSSYPRRSKYRYRYCNNPSPACGGRSCYGSSKTYKYSNCNTHYCKVNGGWTGWNNWGSWGSCSASCRTCGSSVIPRQIRSKRRSCSNPSPGCGGSTCRGYSYSHNSRNCNNFYCKVNGGWSSWTSWKSSGSCSASCRTEGSPKPVKKILRKRSCNNPSPACNGKPCTGTSIQSSKKQCNTHYCPVNGRWSGFTSWSEWSGCSKSCVGGLREKYHTRSCTNPEPKHGGTKCNGKDKEIVRESCNTFKCPSYCTCIGSGDPHYYTPDRAEIHFMGTCKYTLWQSTSKDDECAFRVEAKNERRYGNTRVAYTRMVDFYIGDDHVRILKGGTTMINGVAIRIPASASNAIQITMSGSFITVVHSKCNIRVQFDGNHMLDIKVPKNYFGGNLTGICGNCNGVQSDDYKTKTGEDVSTMGWGGYAKIGNSYKVTDDSDLPNAKCADAEDPGKCSNKLKGLAKSNKYCGYLVSDSSPFKACRDSRKVDFSKMYSSCEFDVCSSDKADANCQTLESTALACSQHGYFVKWRTSSFCAKKCDGDFVYKTSVSCTNTCEDPLADQRCKDPPVDGCGCPDKMYLSGGKCVTKDKCGTCNLTISGISTKLAVDDVYPQGDCIDKKQCKMINGVFTLVLSKASKACASDEWCKPNNVGVYSCTKKPQHGYWEWGSWLQWDACSTTCESGVQKRIRYNNCIGPKHGGKSCPQKVAKTHTFHRGCNRNIPCPINGNWTAFDNWSQWSACSYSCGGGLRQRGHSRSCTNPKPQHGGNKCAGLAKETAFQNCNTFKCPSYCTCSGSGDPHYYTPDGAVIHFMGICKYTLWQSTNEDDSCAFRVETKNERRHGSSSVAYTRMIDFYMGTTQIRILQGRSVMINGVAVSIPTWTANKTIEITESGSYVTVVHSKCNIRVQFDGVHIVNIRVPENKFAGNLTGICGNCNKITADDYSTKSGEKVGSWEYTKIGNSYKVKDDSDQPDSNCANNNEIITKDVKPCTDAEKEKAKSNNFCGFLKSNDSPFKECRDSKKIDFVKMYTSCEYDVCSTDKSDAHCQTLEGTALACSQHGYRVRWRNSTFCPLKCKDDFVYKESVSCTNTCDNPTADRNCKDPPVDGCTCPDKTYLSGGKCVAFDKCGSCDLKTSGLFSKLALDDTYPKGECIDSQKCAFINGTFKLKSVKANSTCQTGDWCTTNEHGVYECRKKPINGGWTTYDSWSEWNTCSKSCGGGKRQRTRSRSCANPKPQHGGKNCVGSPKETVFQDCNTFKCPSYCICSGSGDPHYYTPDGAAIHFMGTCKYTLWQSTNKDDSCAFRVETKNDRRNGYPSASFTRMIDFYMGTTQVRILQGRSVMINGIAVSIPAWTSVNNTIEVTESGSYVTVVHSKCNIRVQFDGVHIFNIRVPENKFAGNLTGICGNCNKVTADDYSTKSGEKVGSREYTKIGNSYKVKDDSDQPDSNCAKNDVESNNATKPCTDAEKEKAKSKNFCGFLKSNDSPFKECRDAKKVDFTQMYSSCEYDVCSTDKSDAHCQTLEGTALACSQHGYRVKWRNATFCPLKCKDGFVYKESVSCTNTCDNPTADRNCRDPPIDGCTCPYKTYLSGGKCVAFDQCGSCDLKTNGLFSKLTLGDEYPTGKCVNSQRCDFINESFQLVSVRANTTCQSGDWCAPNAHGVYECTKKPIHGNWTAFDSWSEWSKCTSSCGGGKRLRTRFRSCTNPRPLYGGNNCVGLAKEVEVQDCNISKCPNEVQPGDLEDSKPVTKQSYTIKSTIKSGGGKETSSRVSTPTTVKPDAFNSKTTVQDTTYSATVTKGPEPKNPKKCIMIHETGKAGNDADWDRGSTQTQPSLKACEQFCLDYSRCLSVHYTEGYCFVYNQLTTTEAKSGSTYSLKNCTENESKAGGLDKSTTATTQRNTMKTTTKNDKQTTHKVSETTSYKPKTESEYYTSSSMETTTQTGLPEGTSAQLHQSVSTGTEDGSKSHTTESFRSKNSDTTYATVTQTMPNEASSDSIQPTTSKAPKDTTKASGGENLTTQAYGTDKKLSTTIQTTVEKNQQTTTKTSEDKSSPTSTTKATSVDKPTSTTVGVDDNSSTTTTKGPDVDKPTSTIAGIGNNPTTTTTKAPDVDEPTSTIAGVGNNPSTTSTKAPSVDKPTSTIAGVGNNPTTTSTKAPSVDKPTSTIAGVDDNSSTTTTKAPYVDKPTATFSGVEDSPPTTAETIPNENQSPATKKDRNQLTTSKPVVESYQSTTTAAENKTTALPDLATETTSQTTTSNQHAQGITSTTKSNKNTLPTSMKPNKSSKMNSNATTPNAPKSREMKTTLKVTTIGRNKGDTTVPSASNSKTTKTQGVDTMMTTETFKTKSTNWVNEEPQKVTEGTVSSTLAKKGFKCKSTFGYYPDPDNCAGFIRCNWGKPIKMPCAKGTIWSQGILTCVHGQC